MTTPSQTRTVDEALRLGTGFASDERAGIVETLANLDARLQSFTPGTVELLLAVKDRDRSGQRVTLEARLAGAEPVIAASDRPDLAAALLEVRDEAIRQISDAKNQTEPRNTRRLRTGKRGQ